MNGSAHLCHIGPARRRRTILFVGALTGGLPDALAAGADVVCIDLEDAVPPGRKEEGRRALACLLVETIVPEKIELAVRVNSLREMEGLADMRACLLHAPRLDALVLPKVMSAEEIRWAGGLADEASSRVALLPIIETPDGLSACRDIALAHSRLGALLFGGFDLSTALGCEMAWEPLLYARSCVVHAAAAAGVDALDSPFPGLDDATGLRESAGRARDLGMAGKTAKDARQIPILRQVFTPGRTELDSAAAILRRFDLDPTAPLVVDGKLIELPTIKRLRRIAQHAEA